MVRNGGPEAEDLEQCLQGLGYRVCAVAASAAQAIERAADATPDAALVDLELEADVSGFEAAGRIGSELDIPVVCLTDSADVIPLQPARTVLPFGYVLKPFDARQLRMSLTTALALRERESRHRETKARLEGVIDELRERVHMMDVIFDSMEEGVIAVDHNGDRLAFNAGAVRIGGLREPNNNVNEWAAMHGVYRLDEETLLPVDENPLVLAMCGQETDGAEVFVRNKQHPQGLHVSVNGRPLRDACGGHRGGLVVFKDVTKEKAAERHLRGAIDELREERELLQAVFDSIHEGILVSDQSGEFLYANPAAKDILDHEYLVRRQAPWKEKPNAVFYHPDRVTPIKNEDLPLPRAIFQGEATDDMNIFLRRPADPNGGVFLWTSARPLRRGTGEVRGGVIIFRDVTDWMLAQETLTQAFTQGRLEIVDTVLHNIGNAINSVTTGADTLYRSLSSDRLVRGLDVIANALRSHREDWINYIENDPQGQKMLPFIIKLAEDAARHNKRLVRTVDRVRSRAHHIAEIVRTQRVPRASTVSPGDVNLKGAIADAVNVVRESMDAGGIRFTLDCANAPRKIKVRENPFFQTLVNVISNAVQAIQARAKEEEHEEAPHIRIHADTGEDCVNIEVSDNGIGFARKDTRVFFAAGYSTRQSGTGLGLHSAANFVVGSGGRIDLSSDGIGKGATVRISLRPPPRLTGKGRPGQHE